MTPYASAKLTYEYVEALFVNEIVNMPYGLCKYSEPYVQYLIINKILVVEFGYTLVSTYHHMFSPGTHDYASRDDSQ